MTLIDPTNFEDCFLDQPGRPPLSDDLGRAQRYRRAALVRRGWAAGLATAAVVAVAVGLTTPPALQTAVPVAPPASSSAPAPTEEPTSDWPTLKQIADQQRVDKALEPMSKIVKNDGGNDPHYATSSVSIEQQTATIYWKGAVPKLVRDLEGTTATGVRVSIVPAAYSQRDASRAAHDLIAAGRRGAIPQPNGVALSNTGDSLVVGFSAADFDRYGQAQLSRDVRSVTDLRFRLIQASHTFTESPTVEPYAAVSDATIAALRSQGTELTVVQTDRSADAAVEAASDSSTKRPVEVSLARATVRDYQNVSSSDPDATGKRLIQDRLVWVVVFGKQRQYVSHPGSAPGQKSYTLYQMVSLASLVDAKTNKVLYGETFG